MVVVVVVVMMVVVVVGHTLCLLASESIRHQMVHMQGT